jgi:uncharacterized membrane protein YdcZ (DUF606 family)
MAEEQKIPEPNKTKIQPIGFWFFIGGMIGMVVASRNIASVIVAGVSIVCILIVQNRMKKST